MSESGHSTDNVPDPLRAIRDDLQRRDAEVTNQASRSDRRHQLDERLGDRLRDLISFAGGLLAPEAHPRGKTFFADLGRSLLAFNGTLREADREYPSYRILERLGRAARAGVTALDTAASLLLIEPTGDVEVLARDLAQFQGSRPHDVWSMWLTYILDQLMNSHRPPTKDSVPPDTTRDEWRKAEQAFGCIVFSDDTFRVMQESMDHAASLIDDAFKCGGHRVLNRPPGRVRDLIARFDPRALHWYGSELLPVRLLQPPPSIEAITEPESLRRQMDELWTAANCLQIALDKWTAWFVELQEKGDAHPAIALNCDDMARRAIKVLLTHRPNGAPFDRADENALLEMLPPIPAWWMPETDAEPNAERGGLIEKVRVRWQADRAFLDLYYWAPERRQEKAIQLRAAAAQLVDLLRSFPMTALAPPSSPATGKRQSMSIAKGALPVATVGIITALPQETAALLAILGEPPRIDVPGSGAGRAYWIAELASPLGGVHRIVIAQADVGNNLAANRAALLLSHFPRVDVIMCGIAGGIPNPAKPAEHVRLADVVVSNHKGVVQYDFVKRKVKRKRTEVPEEIRASPHRPSALFLEAVRILQANLHLGQYPWEAPLERGLIRLGWARPDPLTDVLADTSGGSKALTHPEDAERRTGQPRVFLGPIASANILLKDPVRRDALRDQFGAKAVEMEGSGIQDATWSHGVGYLVVRGVCDYCDSNKNDLWQRYAAVVAAAYVRALLEAMPGSAAAPSD